MVHLSARINYALRTQKYHSIIFFTCGGFKSAHGFSFSLHDLLPFYIFAYYPLLLILAMQVRISAFELARVHKE